MPLGIQLGFEATELRTVQETYGHNSGSILAELFRRWKSKQDKQTDVLPTLANKFRRVGLNADADKLIGITGNVEGLFTLGTIFMKILYNICSVEIAPTTSHLSLDLIPNTIPGPNFNPNPNPYPTPNLFIS